MTRQEHLAAVQVTEAHDLIRQAVVKLGAAQGAARSLSARVAIAAIIEDAEALRESCRDFGFTFDYDPAPTAVA